MKMSPDLLGWGGGWGGWGGGKVRPVLDVRGAFLQLVAGSGKGRVLVSCAALAWEDGDE